MPDSMQAGDVLADRYRLEDLLAETGTGRFWRAHDLVLHRPVAVHIITVDDARSEPMLEAARRVGPLADRRLLRVLDAEVKDGRCYVVNEWGQGDSLDNVLVREGPLSPRRAAWLVAEVAESIAGAHDVGLAHGRLVPENVLIDQHGQVRIIGFGVDAALRGLAPGRFDVDITDLAALLYAALTGKWPGASQSLLPDAPLEHGTFLRPRRVRAGIPRVLDAICDQALDPTGAGAVSGEWSARTIADHLQEYVGELTGTQLAVPAMTPTTSATPTETTSTENTDIPDAAVAPPVPAAPPGPPGRAADDTPAVPTSSIDLPTQAGMPVFHDDDEVDWLRARSEPVTPPPPLDDVPPKPLFAPDPPEGEPVRRPRPGSQAAATPSDFWPWGSPKETGAPPPPPPHTPDTGSWATGSSMHDSWGTGEGFDDTGEQVPGRNWIRLAMILAVGLLIMVVAVSVYQLGLKTSPGDPPPDDEPSAAPVVAEPTPFTDVSAVDFDPQGVEPREEYPELVPNVLDGDSATSWHTATYKQNFGPGGLKTGVGLIVDLGTTKGVRQVVVGTSGGATSLAAYVTTTAPTGIADLTPVGTASGTDDLTITLDEPVSGQYVTIWLTLLPSVSDGFRGTVTSVQVLG